MKIRKFLSGLFAIPAVVNSLDDVSHQKINSTRYVAENKPPQTPLPILHGKQEALSRVLDIHAEHMDGILAYHATSGTMRISKNGKWCEIIFTDPSL